jgi:hypothetical protein
VHSRHHRRVFQADSIGLRSRPGGDVAGAARQIRLKPRRGEQAFVEKFTRQAMRAGVGGPSFKRA